MRKRFYRARVWLDEKEYDQFIKNVAKTGLPKETYLRMLITGYQPREMPPLQYHKIIQQLSAIGHNLNQIAARYNSLNDLNAKSYSDNYQALMSLVLTIQNNFELHNAK